MVIIVLPHVESGMAGLEEHLRRWGGEVVPSEPRVFVFEDSLRLIQGHPTRFDRECAAELLGNSTTSLLVSGAIVDDWADGLASPSQRAILRRLFEQLGRATSYVVVVVRDSGQGEQRTEAEPQQVFDVVDRAIRGESQVDVTVVSVPGSDHHEGRQGW